MSKFGPQETGTILTLAPAAAYPMHQGVGVYRNPPPPLSTQTQRNKGGYCVQFLVR